MKNLIHDKLKNIDEYLLSIRKDLENDHYVIEIGVKSDWINKDSLKISCEDEIIYEDNNPEKEVIGKVVKIFPKDSDVLIDDLINFVIKIVDANKKIEEMQSEFQVQLENRKELLKNEIVEFQNKLDEIKDKISLDDENNPTDNKEIPTEKEETTESLKDMNEDLEIAQKIK